MKYMTTLFLFLFSTSCFAEWDDIPLETVVANSDLVVVARLKNIQHGKNDELVFCQGTLQISEVLKGAKVKKAILKWAYGVPPKEDSVDHTNLKDKLLLWLLKQETDESYSAHYIKRIQSVDEKEEIQRIINSLKVAVRIKTEVEQISDCVNGEIVAKNIEESCQDLEYTFKAIGRVFWEFSTPTIGPKEQGLLVKIDTGSAVGNNEYLLYRKTEKKLILLGKFAGCEFKIVT